MGLISDFLSASVGIDVAAPIDPLDRRAYRELQAIVDEGDMVLPLSLQAADEVQSIAVHVGTVSGGDFTLEFTLWSGETFTTAAIAWNANAATIEGAIDTAATAASIIGWTNADISIALSSDLNAGPATVTFDGTSVTGANHVLIVMDDSGLTGGGSGGAITVSTEGQADRLGYGVLTLLGIVSGTVPAEGVTPSALVVSASSGVRRLSAETIRAVSLEIAVVENNEAIEVAINTAAGV